MHAEAYDYIRREASLLPLAGKDVFEIGSYNVNGSVRPLFASARCYTGIDVRPGPGVDLVLDVCDADLDMLPLADIVVTTETLEHAERPQDFINAALRMLRPGGVLLLTCASVERAPHACDGGPVVPAHESYHRLAPDEIISWLPPGSTVLYEHHPARGDFYARVEKAWAT